MDSRGSDVRLRATHLHHEFQFSKTKESCKQHADDTEERSDELTSADGVKPNVTPTLAP